MFKKIYYLYKNNIAKSDSYWVWRFGCLGAGAGALLGMFLKNTFPQIETITVVTLCTFLMTALGFTLGILLANFYAFIDAEIKKDLDLIKKSKK